MTLEELRNYCATCRRDNLRIVSTNGCFDLLHPGHVCTLKFAKGLGDILVVGVDTDEHVRVLKGPNRPIMMLSDRLKLLEAIRYVDVAVPINDVTEFLEAVQPAVHVKGGDYRSEELPEGDIMARLGGHMAIAPYCEGMSTTSLIFRVKSGAAGQS